MSSGSGNCTVGIENITTYTFDFDRLEISDQGGNPAGYFNQTELRMQAMSQTYAVSELVMNRDDIVMLYKEVLPGREIPNLDFLNEPIVPSPTTTVVTQTTTGGMPRPTGGATAVSFSLFITLVALLFTSVFL